MKKLALLLGSLAIAATSYAGGKEYVPPVENVQVREIYVDRPVYRNIMNGGYLEIYYKWWGQSTEHERDDWEWASNDKKVKTRQKNGNRGRLHIQGLVNLTERQSIYFRVRDNQAISDNGLKTFITAAGEKDYHSSESTQVRLRYNFKHDFANLNATSRLHYQNDGEYTGAAIGKNNLEYQFRMQFAEYGFDNSFIKTTNLVIAPKVGYSWDNSSKTRSAYDGVGHASTPYFGLDFYIDHKLPWNFSLEFALYLNSVHSNYKFYGEKKSNFQATAELYLKNKTPLWTGDKAKLSFVFEGGFDPYRYSQRKIYNHELDDYFDGSKSTTSQTEDKTSYSLYALPALQIDYQATENVNLFVAAGAEMRNIHETGCEAQGFVWQPTAWAGFKVNF